MQQLPRFTLTAAIVALLAAPAQAAVPPASVQFGVGGGGNVRIEPGHALVNGLGGSQGFGEGALARDDDGFEPWDVSAVFESGLNYFGTVYDGGTQLFIGRNGYITLGQGSGAYGQAGIAGYTIPIIAPFFTDVDTRDVPASYDAAGNSTGTNRIYVDVDPIADCVTITFDDIGEYSHITTHLNAYQIRLWDLGAGDFAIEFRYEWMEWAAHGGWATAGWSAGDQTHFEELPASGTAAMLDLETASNIGQPGVYFWQVIGGGVSEYQASVPEDAAAGAVVGPLRVTDADLNDSHTLTLLDDAGGRFEIVDNAGTPELRVKAGASFDYETAPTLSVTVRATDSFGLSRDEVLDVAVADVNEAPTAVALSSASVDEDAPVGTTVGLLTTTDEDDGDTFTYAVLTAGAPFAVAGSQLRVASPLDHEAQGSWNVTVRATDAGGLTHDQALQITVADVNEAPTGLALTGSTVDEDRPVGHVVGALSASDEDAGDSLTYSLVTVGAPFEVTAPGQLRVAGPLDFEAQTAHTLTIRVTDASGLSQTSDFAVMVADVNEAPTGIAVSNTVLPEDSVSGITVGTLTAIDQDLSDSHGFVVVESGTPFAIAGDLLRLAGTLDYEAATHYDLTLQTIDEGGLYYEQVVRITVTDVNEPPTDLLVSTNSVGETTPVGSAAATFSAVDEDFGDTHTYRLLSPVPFELVGNELRPTAPLDFETEPSHTFVVRVTDSAGHAINRTFTLTVLDENEPPTTLDLAGAHRLDENAPAGTVVGTLSTADPDAGDSHTFSVQGGAPFTVVGHQLQSAGALDHEAQAVHTVTVRVTDAGGLFIERDYDIAVNDVNEAPSAPVLDNQQIAEGSPVGAAVGGLSSVDPDAGDALTFSLVGAGVPFAVQGSRLVVAGALDHEAQASFTLTVRATDDAGLFTEQTFAVAVTDVNEAPTALSVSQTSVPEDASPGATVASLGVSDQDAGDTHTYALLGAGVPFAIAGSELRVGAALDHETAAAYALDLRVTDAGGLSFERTVVITVRDVNEAPTVLSVSATDVDENTPVGSVVARLGVVDEDAGDLHVFSVVSGPAFEALGDELRVAAPLDHEAAASHDVTLRVTDAGGLSIDRTVTLAVRDVNEAPTLISLSSQTVQEGASVGSAVGTLSATDEDAGDSHTFALLDPAPFSIAGDVLEVAAALDHEAAAQHSLRVRVTDAGGLSYEQTFVVEVQDANEAPTGLSLSARSVDENLPAGTLVGALSGEDPDEGDALAFSLRTSGVPFAIVAGELRTTASLDHEAAASFSLDLRVTDAAGLTYDEALTVDVVDVNEAPSAPSLDVTQLAEDTPVGQTVGHLSASDPDAGDTLTFELLESGLPVVVVGRTLRLAAPLDHEAASSLSFTVRASDAAGASAQQGFVLTVVDVNEAPTAIALSASAAPEDASPGLAVGRLSATDPDSAETFTYAIVGAPGAFSISGDQLLVAGALDHEASPAEVVRVRVTDAAGLSFEQAFTVLVTDVNEAPTDLRLSASAVPEDAAVGATVALLTAIDEDAGDTHVFSLVSGSHFEVVGDALRVAAPLDYELSSQHSLTLRVEDAGGLVFERALTVDVSDVNEAPTDITLSANQVAEGLEAGSVIGALAADDPDGDDLHTFTVATVDALLAVDASGNLVTAAPLDFEATPELSVTVRAVDRGGLSVERAFTVRVQDVNEAPSALSLSADHLPENSPAGAVVGSVLGEDPDLGDALTFAVVDPSAPFEVVGQQLVSKVAFDHEAQPTVALEIVARDGAGLSLVRPFVVRIDDVDEPPTAISLDATQIAENAVNGAVLGRLSVVDEDEGDLHSFAITNVGVPFAIDGDLVRVAGAVDYEVATSHTLEIEVVDRGGFRLSRAFTITVTDVNEPPARVTLAQDHVAEDVAVGAMITTVSVVDADADDDHTLSVTTRGVPFAIGEGGKLVCTSGLDYEQQQSWVFVVRVVDRGGLAYDEVLSLYVDDVNEPPLALSLSSRTVDEDAPVGAAVGRLDVEDPDFTDTHELAVLDPDAHFEVRGDELVVARALDYERRRSHTITVEARDSGGLTVQQAFTIEVVDANDNPPRIDAQRFLVSEAAEAGTLVGRIAASDPDDDPLHFTLRSGNDRGWFALEADGSLRVAPGAALDAEDEQRHALLVEVSDAGHVASATISVSLIDENDNAPTLEVAHWAVPEDTEVGAEIGQLVAEDADHDPLRFALEGDGADAFVVDARDGRVYVAGDGLDREVRLRYDLTAVVQDGLHERRAQLRIWVDGVNDNPPVLPDQVLSVAEDAPLGATVDVVAAFDADGDDLQYSIEPAHPAFAIDVRSGRLVVVDPRYLALDGARTQRLTVRVTDGRHAAEARVEVNLSDERDPPPELADARFEIPYDAAAGALVGDVPAVDPLGDRVRLSVVTGDPVGAFDLDPVTGRLTVARPEALAACAAKTYRLVLRATDGWNRSTALVEIVRVERRPPTMAAHTFSAPHHAGAGFVLGQVFAEDVDDDPLELELADEGDAAAFAFDPETRLLTVSGVEVMERAVKASYALTFVVRDGHHEVRAPASVRVLAPDAAPLAVADVAFTVSEDAPQNLFLGELGELGEGSEVQLLAGGGDGLFTLSEGGALSLTCAPCLDYEAAARHRLVAEVTRGEATTQVILHVDVLDVHDTPAPFSDRALSVAETAPRGAELGVVSSDAPVERPLGHRIAAGDPEGAFAIDRASGLVTVADPGQVDFEARDRVLLVVELWDPPFLDSAFVEVEVQGANDNPPIPSVVDVEVDEDAEVGTELARLEANDADGDALEWRVVGGDPAGRFTLEARTGTLRLAGALDFEAEPHHTLDVRVSDGAFEARAQVQVTVRNVNDNPPELVPHVFLVPSDVAAGDRLGVVMGDDADGDPLEYHLAGGEHAGAFRVQPDGALVLAAPEQLDFEALREAEQSVLWVDAYDGVHRVATKVTLRYENREAPEPVPSAPLEDDGGCRSVGGDPGLLGLGLLLGLGCLIRRRRGA